MESEIIKITSVGGPQSVADESAEELAWQHATLIARMAGEEPGSDWFIEVYNHLRERYGECADSFGFLHNLATRALKELMESGMAVTIPPDASAAEIEARFTVLIAAIFSTIAWAHASHPHGWMTNDEWDSHTEEERTVEFIFFRPKVTLKDNNDPTDR